MLIITLSELMSDVQVTQMRSDGSLEESGEARRLRKSLEEMKDETKSSFLLEECGLLENALVAIPEKKAENRWSWSEVKYLSDSLLLALDGSLEHALLVSFEYICTKWNQFWFFVAEELLLIKSPDNNNTYVELTNIPQVHVVLRDINSCRLNQMKKCFRCNLWLKDIILNFNWIFNCTIIKTCNLSRWMLVVKIQLKQS